MASFHTLTAVAAPIAVDKLDTDQIFPGRFSGKERKDGNFGLYYLHDQRFDETGARRAGCILNDDRLTNVQIIVSGASYACGSGRPGAIHAHVDFGVRAIIAESFGPVFASVAYKAGLLAIQLSRPEIDHLTANLLDHLGATVSINLPDQLVIAPDGTPMRFAIDPFVKRIIMDGLSEIDFTLGLGDRIEAFELRQRARLPWVFAPR